MSVESEARARLAEFLPCALQTALVSYQLFLEQGLPTGDKDAGEDKIRDKAKEFKAHHEACKMAIGHIKMLLELANSHGLADMSDAEDIRSFLEHARREISDYHISNSKEGEEEV